MQSLSTDRLRELHGNIETLRDQFRKIVAGYEAGEMTIQEEIAYLDPVVTEMNSLIRETVRIRQHLMI